MSKNSTDIEKRLAQLASDKARLSVVNHMYERLYKVRGLDNIINTILDISLNMHGGTNLILYYNIGAEWYYADIYGEKGKINLADEPDLLEAWKTDEIQNSYTELKNPNFDIRSSSSAEIPTTCTTVFPLSVYDRVIGMVQFKERIVHDVKISQDIKTFFHYAAFVLNNEIQNLSDLQKSVDELVNIFETNPDGMVVINQKFEILRINSALLKLLNTDKKAVIGERLNKIISIELPGNGDINFLQQISQKKIETDAIIKNKNGKQIDCILKSSPIKSHKDVIGTVINIKDISDRKLSERVINTISEGIISKTGDEFLQNLAKYFANALDFKVVFIGKYHTTTNSISTVALYYYGKIVDNISYKLDDTPCEKVINQKVCTYPDHVQELFPKDHLLVEMNANCYIGTPLFDKNREPLGVMAALSDKVLDNPQNAESILQIFAVRAAAELERSNYEKSIVDSLHEKEILLQEIHHRVKNNLQIISSLLNMQARKIDHPEALQAFQESKNRIYSMSLVHENLYRSKDFAHIKLLDYIKSVSKSLFKAYNVSKNINLDFNISDVDLTINNAVPCGLIINELVSNSLKHAFKDDSGTISIDINQENSKLYIEIKDDGIGIPEQAFKEQSSTLGLHLVEILVEQLAGTLKVDTNNGTKYTIQFPL